LPFAETKLGEIRTAVKVWTGAALEVGFFFEQGSIRIARHPGGVA